MADLSFNQFIDVLNKTPNKLIKELGRIMIKTALNMEKQAKRNATVDPKVRTGRLRASITGQVLMKLGEPRIVLRAGGSSIRGVSGGVSDVNYARKIEEGLENIRYPRFFLRKAFDKEGRTLENDLQKALLRASNG